MGTIPDWAPAALVIRHRCDTSHYRNCQSSVMRSGLRNFRQALTTGLHSVNTHQSAADIFRHTSKNNIEVERALLGAIVINNSALQPVTGFLQRQTSAHRPRS